jgi:hypothetical protein
MLAKLNSGVSTLASPGSINSICCRDVHREWIAICRVAGFAEEVGGIAVVRLQRLLETNITRQGIHRTSTNCLLTSMPIPVIQIKGVCLTQVAKGCCTIACCSFNRAICVIATGSDKGIAGKGACWYKQANSRDQMYHFQAYAKPC